MPLEIHFHARGLSYYRPMARARTDSLCICPYDFPTPSGWYGYHEALGTLRSFGRGVPARVGDVPFPSVIRVGTGLKG